MQTHYLVGSEIKTEIYDIDSDELIELAHLDSDELEDDFDKHLDKQYEKITILDKKYTYSEVAKEINYSEYKKAKTHFVETEVLLGNYFIHNDEIFCVA